MDWLTKKLKDPEWRRLYEEELAKLEKQYTKKGQRKEMDPWWKNTFIGVLAHPCNIYKK